jgi:hypothetical protein
MTTPLDYTGHFGRNIMSLQGTRSSQPFGPSNESVASTHEQCTSTTLHNEIVCEAPRGASVMYAVCCVTAPRTFLSFFSPFSFLFVTHPPCGSFIHMALFVFPVIPRMTQVFPFCSLPTPKLYANFLLVPIFVLSYRLMPSIGVSVFCMFSTAL